MAFEIKIKNSVSPPTFQGLAPLTMKGDSTGGGGGVVFLPEGETSVGHTPREALLISGRRAP